MRRLVPGAEAGERLFKVEGRVGHFGPAAERAAMLTFLAAPLLDQGLGFGVGKYALEIGDVIGRVELDEGGRLDGGR